MKKLILILLIASTIIACNNNNEAKLQKTCALVEKLQQQIDSIEFVNRNHVELWASATNIVGGDENIGDYSFTLKVISSIKVPVFLTDSMGNVVSHKNLNIDNPSKEDISALIDGFTKIETSFYKKGKHNIYYGEPSEIKEMK
ncbi:MAG: hypothetical protein HOB26_11835, partial [Flavobacteriales bacterium]|nr:hypothetical protein [Flavobacteriales bacterium]